jgi:uncharacterized OB-fold protein
MAQMAMAGVLAGLFCDKNRRTVADLACKRFVCSLKDAPLAPATNFWQRFPMPLVLVLTMSAYLFLAPIIMFSFGQMGNLVYRNKLSAWRAQGLHTKGRVVFVERRIMAPSVLSESDLAEFEVDPESLPPDAIVARSAVLGKKIVGIVNEGAVLTIENFDKADAKQIELAEASCPAAVQVDPRQGILVYRWRDRVKRGQVIGLKDIEPVYIVEEQFIDSICCTPWQIVGRTVSENCQALKGDIIHCQYVDAPVSTLVAKRALKKGATLKAEDVANANLSAKKRYYTAISAPHLALGAKPHLVANECVSCGARYFDRRNACAGCFGTAFKKVDVDTSGEVRAFTIVAHAAPGIPVPFVSAIVDCGGTSVRANIINTIADPQHISLGLRVRLATYSLGKDDAGVEAIGFGFEPAQLQQDTTGRNEP